MILYLAGGVSGNLNPAWKACERATLDDFVKGLCNENFWQGGERRHWLHDPPTKENEETNASFWRGSHLTGVRGGYDPIIRTHHPYILESFYYVDSDTERLIPIFGDFLLDSGAFTFMMNSKSHVAWEEYIERYADFVKRNNIQKFFELDIDSVVGYKKVLEYRHLLEKLVGRPCIPVWHKSRGMDEFIRMCEEYEYSAIGGIVAGEIKPDQYGAFPKMIKLAHQKKCKVHGLGFTSLGWLKKCHFDSVDSTAWTTGNRFGFIYHFDGETMRKVDCPKGKRLADARKTALINYTEWIKFQKYAETHY